MYKLTKTHFKYFILKFIKIDSNISSGWDTTTVC